MGKAHSNAYRKIAYMTWPPPLVPRLVAVAGRPGDAVAEAARRYGFEGYVTNWRELVENDEVELVDNSCVAAAGVKHMCAFKLPLRPDCQGRWGTWERM